MSGRKSTGFGAGGTATSAIAQIGGSDTASGDAFYSRLNATPTDGIRSFAGTINGLDGGLMFNAVGTIAPIPKPSVLGIAAVAGLVSLRRRRKC